MMCFGNELFIVQIQEDYILGLLLYCALSFQVSLHFVQMRVKLIPLTIVEIHHPCPCHAHADCTGLL
jgi:uncharacterized Zn finger protein